MNFQSEKVPAEQQIANLLAFITFMERKIESLKKKLAGNQEFHTRLIFQFLDSRKISSLKPDDFSYYLNGERTNNRSYSTIVFENLFRKYTMSNEMSYDEFLKLLIPKSDKSLSQRLLIRNPKRGAQIPSYVLKIFGELIQSFVQMSETGQKIRIRIQKSSQLTLIDMAQFFRKCMNSQRKMLQFINNVGGMSQLTESDLKFLSYHLKSGNSVRQFEQQDIKQLMFPLDMNFQKQNQPLQTHLYPEQKQKFKNPEIKAEKMNFLRKTYQKTQATFPVPSKGSSGVEFQAIMKPSNGWNILNQVENNLNLTNNRISNRQSIVSGGKLYIDNFIKPIDNSLNLNRFINQSKKNSFQKFEDQLPQSDRNSSNSSSAFHRYKVI